MIGARVLKACGAAALAFLAGCVEVAPPPPPPPTTVELVNATSLDVRANFYVSATATSLFDLFIAANLSTAWTDRAFPELRPRETRTISFECDQLASLGVNAPVMFDAATLVATPSVDQIFLRRDTDFSCGPKIRFVYYLDGTTFRVRVEFP